MLILLRAGVVVLMGAFFRSVAAGRAPAADAVATHLFEDESPVCDKLWDVLERIAEDPDEAKHASWTNYVSSRDLWGTKIPGTDLTVFWRTIEDRVVVALLVEDPGLGVQRSRTAFDVHAIATASMRSCST